MGPIFAFVLSIIALSSATASQNYFFTNGKEIVFKYESHVTVQTDQPASYASLYELQAKVHVQKNEEDTLMVRLDNIVFDLENGPMQESVTNHVYVTIPKEAEALSLPFAIKYDSNKLVTAVMVDSNDQEWSYNIKKSIASIFQFNTEVLSTFDRKESHVEYSREQTIYGLCNVTYDVLPRNDHIMVIKTADPRQCGDNYNLKRNANLLDVDSNRIYKINQKDKNARIEMIEARGDIVIAKFRATSEMKSLKVHQRFTFVEEVAVTNPFIISNQLVLRSLKYEDPLSKCRDGPILTDVDITGGRAKYNNDILIPKIHAWLDQLANVLQENHLTLTKPDSKLMHLLQNLYDKLENFDLTTLEHISALLQEKSQVSFKLFVQLLPHVGTRSSALLLRNLIRKKKIDDSMAVLVLRDLPAHVRCPNEKLLTELEDMLGLDTEGSRVHVASVLAYATLIKRTYLGVEENSTVLDKYEILFLKKVLLSQDYNIRVLYLHALGNIGMESVIHILAPILTGELPLHGNLRSLALWAVAPLFQKNPSLMIKYIWPILSDRKLDIGLRTIAYDIYVRTEKPTLNRFMQLYWLMRVENNERFYNFHYNTLVTMTHLQYVLNNEKQIIEIARAILRMSRHPIVAYENEGIFVKDFIDKESGLGGKIDTMYSFGNDVTIRSRTMSRVYGFDVEMFSFHFGVVTPTNNDIKSKESAPKYVELIVRREGRVVMIYVEDTLTPRRFFDIIKDLGVNIDTNEHNQILEIPYLYERIMPTDFGVPIRMPELLSHIYTIYGKIDNTENKNMKFDFKIKTMTLHNTAFQVYNPINDLWHGIEEISHMNFQLGFTIFASQKDDGVYQIKIKTLSKDAGNGLQVHTETVAFIKGENAQELLKQSHKESLVRRSIIRGEDYITDTVVYDTECNTLGQHVQVKIFDCDRDLSSGGLITRLQEINTDENNDGFMTLELLNLYLSTLFPTGNGRCGYGVILTPLETFDHMEFDVTMFTKGEVSKPKDYMLGFVAESITIEMDMQGTTKSVQNTNLATYHSHLNVSTTELQRIGEIKWWIVHKDQVNKERKLDIDLRYQMKEDHLDSKLILSLGEVDKLGVITFDIKGTRSEEQQRILKERKITYNECRPEMVAGKFLAPVPLECAIAHSNLNRYAIHVAVNDVQNRMVKMILSHFNALRHRYFMYVKRTTKDETNDVMPMHLYIDYPIFRKEWDITVDTPSYNEIYLGIPRNEWIDWDLDDNSLPNIFFTLSNWDGIDRVTSMAQCVISKEYVLTLNGNAHKYGITNDWSKWSLYLKASTAEEGEVYSFFVKNVNGNRPLAMQIKMGKDVIEIIPEGHEFVIKVNNNVVTPIVGKYTEEPIWSYLMVESPKMIMFSTRLYGLHVIYDGRTIRSMLHPGLIQNFDGHCAEAGLEQDFSISTASFVTAMSMFGL
ncbi:uncharacterized protein LOC123290637 [Chrysoperla carnea]|uniref:uncharacterized protein LOC123290637 n=1 Tax=Chrysoperla carnea TaxID=189513 RepID=UPI001D06B113|nr:uncharacterized protein LOC123290637 [Chrysoperla carnea]